MSTKVLHRCYCCRDDQVIPDWLLVKYGFFKSRLFTDPPLLCTRPGCTAGVVTDPNGVLRPRFGAVSLPHLEADQCEMIHRLEKDEIMNLPPEAPRQAIRVQMKSMPSPTAPGKPRVLSDRERKIWESDPILSQELH